MYFTELEKGDKVKLVGFGATEPVYRQKLLALGITRGVEILVIRKAPLGCPLQVEARGVALTLRKEEAKDLVWEKM